MPTEELYYSTTLNDSFEDPLDDPEKIDAINATTWSDYKYLSNFDKTDDNLLIMGVPRFSTLSYSTIEGFKFDPTTNYYPILCRGEENEPIWYERVSYHDTDSRPDVENLQLLENIDYEIAVNLNTYFLLTSSDLESARSNNADKALALVNQAAARIIADEPDAGWEIDIGIGDVADILNTMINQVVNGIAPPLDGKEIYAKIKETEFRMDNFISTNLSNIEVPAILNTTPVAVGPTAKLGGFFGASTEGRLLDDDWFAIDDPYSGEFLESETTAEEFFDDFSDDTSPAPTPDEGMATFTSDDDMGGGGGGYGY